MTDRFFILDDDGKVVPITDINEWGAWFGTHDRVVKQTRVLGVWVSTVFLGLNHNFYDNSEPLIFETMIFGGAEDQYQDRYSTREQAEEGHKRAVRLAIKTLPKSLWIFIKDKFSGIRKK